MFAVDADNNTNNTNKMEATITEAANNTNALNKTKANITLAANITQNTNETEATTEAANITHNTNKTETPTTIAANITQNANETQAPAPVAANITQNTNETQNSTLAATITAADQNLWIKCDDFGKVGHELCFFEDDCEWHGSQEEGCCKPKGMGSTKTEDDGTEACLPPPGMTVDSARTALPLAALVFLFTCIFQI